MLTSEEVKNIARLARLGLRPDELEKFQKQLSGILDHAKMLEEIDTSGVEPIAQITGLTNVTFPDVVETCAFPEELLAQSPQTVQDRMIKVKNVF